MSRLTGLFAAAAVAVTPILAVSTSPADATVASQYKSCAALNRTYPAGVGKKGARDKTSGTPVRNFRVDTKLYNSLPKTLDRDRDGIACEKHTARAAPAPTSRPKRPVSKSTRRVLSSPGGFGFVTPSGNITCLASRGDVRCDITEVTYRLPKRPKSCDLDYGQAFLLTRTSSVLCASDTIGGSASPAQNWFRKTGLKPIITNGTPQAVLPYGWTLNSTTISCTSATTGVTCRHTRSHHGFTVGRAAYRLF